MGIGSGGILAAADLSVQLVGQGRHIVIRIQVDVKDIFNCCLYFRPKVVAGRRIHELCSAEKILVMDEDLTIRENRLSLVKMYADVLNGYYKLDEVKMA